MVPSKSPSAPQTNAAYESLPRLPRNNSDVLEERSTVLLSFPMFQGVLCMLVVSSLVCIFSSGKGWFYSGQVLEAGWKTYTLTVGGYFEAGGSLGILSKTAYVMGYLAVLGLIMSTVFALYLLMAGESVLSGGIRFNDSRIMRVVLPNAERIAILLSVWLLGFAIVGLAFAIKHDVSAARPGWAYGLCLITIALWGAVSAQIYSSKNQPDGACEYGVCSEETSPLSQQDYQRVVEVSV